MEVIFKWRGKTYIIKEDSWEPPPRQSKEEIKKRLEDGIALQLYELTDSMVDQGLKYGYLMESNNETKVTETKSNKFW